MLNAKTYENELPKFDLSQQDCIVWMALNVQYVISSMDQNICRQLSEL